MIEGYIFNLVIIIGIYFILGLSLQLTIGFTGLFNLGHITFFGVGAYVAALLTIAQFPLGISLLLAGVSAVFVSSFFSIFAIRLKGDYFALAALGLFFIFHSIVLNWIDLTGGPFGISRITNSFLQDISFASNFTFFILVVLMFLFSFFVLQRIVNSPFGKVLESIRDCELAAMALGKNVFKMKFIAIGISAFFAGIAGGLYSQYLSYIHPSSFEFSQMIFILSIVFLGGLASLKGTFLSTIILVLIPELLRFFDLPFQFMSPLRNILYAFILLGILLYKSRGFYGGIKC